MSGFSPENVISWYQSKTESILRKYGPGPRVHFHIGMVEEGEVPAEEPEALRAQMVRFQEALMEHGAALWDAPRNLSGEILEVGCGLGGGALFWAQEYGARVTAITVVPEHVPIVERFARQAGVEDRVKTLVADACTFPGEDLFDAAVCVEASCYLPRYPWFARLAKLVRPGGYVFIQDTFLGKPYAREPFDDYWKTQVGPVDEYVAAARAAGFVYEGRHDVTEETARFWPFSNAFTRLALALPDITPQERARLQRSLEWQSRFHQIWLDRGIVCEFLHFRKP